MQRRKLLAAIGSVAAGGVATVGTGAFSSTAVDRNVTVDVKTDSNAYLGLVPTNDPNGVFADEASSGELEVAFDGSGTSGATGLNQDALTVFENVFQIENQGTQRVQVTLSDGGGTDEEIRVQDPGTIGDGTGGAPDPGGSNGAALSKGSDDIAVALATTPASDGSGGSGKDGSDSDGNIELDPGSSVKVDFAVSTGTDTSFPVVNALTINAEDADDN